VLRISKIFKIVFCSLVFVFIIIIVFVNIEFLPKELQKSTMTNNTINYISDYDIRRVYLKKCLLNGFYNDYYEKNFSEAILFNNLNNTGFDVWTLSINSINLFANISHGTDEEILNKYIGHFEETNIFNGNVGLAAHNRGYPVNYFENLDKIEIGDVIDYRIDDFVKIYKVGSINIIKDTDWTYLEKTNDDRLTLITCVRNKPNYRLCVQACKESEEILNNEKVNNAKISKAEYNDDKNINEESNDAKEVCSNKYGNNFIIKYAFSRRS